MADDTKEYEHISITFEGNMMSVTYDNGIVIVMNKDYDVAKELISKSKSRTLYGSDEDIKQCGPQGIIGDTGQEPTCTGPLGVQGPTGYVHRYLKTWAPIFSSQDRSKDYTLDKDGSKLNKRQLKRVKQKSHGWRKYDNEPK